jgi:hypothetical protein
MRLSFAATARRLGGCENRRNGLLTLAQVPSCERRQLVRTNFIVLPLTKKRSIDLQRLPFVSGRGDWVGCTYLAGHI